MRLAIINCLKANRVCTGAACLQALSKRSCSFAAYKGQELELTAFARCNGCRDGIDEGFTEKLERLVKEGTEVVHFGVCTVKKDGTECPVITHAANYLEDHGVRTVRSTH